MRERKREREGGREKREGEREINREGERERVESGGAKIDKQKKYPARDKSVPVSGIHNKRTPNISCCCCCCCLFVYCVIVLKQRLT